MEITNSPVEWDLQEDREIWSQFLRTRTGSRLIPKLAESCPGLLYKGDVNEILIRNGEVRGVQWAISVLLGLAIPEPAAPDDGAAENYPDLLDDSKWKDGHKLNPQPIK